MAGYYEIDKAKAEAKTRGKLPRHRALARYIEVCGVAPSKWIGAVGEGWGAAMWESANVRVHLTGKVVVTIGTQPQGQGHETTYAQVVAHELGRPDGRRRRPALRHAGHAVRLRLVRQPDRAVGGTSPRSRRPTRSARRRAGWPPTCSRRSVEDIEIDGAEYRVKGSPDKKKTIQEIAFAIDLGFDLPAGMEPYLDETAYYDTPNCTWPFGTHIAIVEVDEETGEVDLVALRRGRRRRQEDQPDDRRRPAPRRHRPGRRPGALGGGRLRRRRAAPVGLDARLRAARGRRGCPAFELDETVTPSPVNPLGVKGVGEAGAIASTPAVVNAVIDALQPVRDPPPRHAAHRAEGLARDAGGEGSPGMIPAAFDYDRPASARRGARPRSRTADDARSWPAARASCRC